MEVIPPRYTKFSPSLIGNCKDFANKKYVQNKHKANKTKPN